MKQEIMSNLDQEEAIFCRAIELSQNERARFLDSACKDDPVLRKGIDALLAQHDTDQVFLETPALEVSPTRLDESAGDWVGAFQLVERIGEGGFGIVWKAKQSRPVQRTVAVKILKLGMKSAQVIEQFDLERQSLALMNHAHIATVFDAGTTSGGRPFFAMELVEGQTVDQHCDQQQLSIEQRLILFIKVCRAVHHAHQKGILHRDLKPSNILVRRDEGEATPKIIDFGIAKATHADQADAQLPNFIMGTPQYMSPEQFGNHPNVDIRADVYSLGALLYKLLTGSPPISRESITDLDFDELTQFVETHTPVKPSLLRTQDQMPRLSRDLDWVTMKALEKRPENRYQSAFDLARDLESYLSRLPVSAAPNNAFYNCYKFVQRHRAATIAAISIVVSLIAGTIGLAVGLVEAQQQKAVAIQQTQLAENEKREANRQRTIAHQEAEEARMVADVLKKLIAGANPSKDRPFDFSMRQQLDEIAKTLDQMEGHPKVEAELRHVVGHTYHALARLEESRVHLKRALELRKSIHGKQHIQTIKSRIAYAAILTRLSQIDEAEPMIESVLASLKNTRHDQLKLGAFKILKRIRNLQLQHEESLELARLGWQICTEIFGPNHAQTLEHQSQYAEGCKKANQLDKAYSLSLAAVESLQKYHPTKKFKLANAKFRLSQILVKQKRLAEALKLNRETKAIHIELFGESDEHVIRNLNSESNILWLLGRTDEAESVARKATQMAELLSSEHVIIRAASYRRLAVILESSNPEEAVDVWKSAIEFRRRYLGPDHSQLAGHFRSLADLLVTLERNDEAADNYLESLRIWRLQPIPVSRLASLIKLTVTEASKAGRIDLATSHRVHEHLEQKQFELALELFDHDL